MPVRARRLSVWILEKLIPTISTGNILRAAVKNGTPTGLRAKEYSWTPASLVPDEVIIGIIQERLQESDCANGYILDGVPRTIAQAEAMETGRHQLASMQWWPSRSLTRKIVARMGGRRVCEHCGASYHIVNIPPKTEGVCDVCGGKLVQRKDDNPETVRDRLEVYHRDRTSEGLLRGPWDSENCGGPVHCGLGPRRRSCVRWELTA